MGQILVLGLIAGAIYGLFALGVVLVYQGTGAINFAQGEVGTLGLFVAWWVVTDQGMPWILGALLAMTFAGLVGAAFERVVIRPMVAATRVSISVATIGLLSLLLALENQLFSPSPRALRAPVEAAGTELFGVVVSPTQWISLGVVALVAVGIGVLLRRTDFGLGVLATAQDPAGARLMGVPFNLVSMFVWGTAAAISVLGALLVVPTAGGLFVPGFASVLFLKGLAAAVVGGLSSMSGAFVGGLALGVIEAAVKDVFGDSSLVGVEILAIFLLVLLVLLFRPGGLVSGLRAKGATA